eukprot:GHVU01129073.1.p1 GENE.GHVU01129073.1~~GHVU01129073.1.p1  ORF type:complete len:267 (-),score=64.65 GHVU01129073.1:164-964(-)
MKYALLVTGPAGCGKSTFCATVQTHCDAIRRGCKVVNLDPAAEMFNYRCEADVRELVSVADVMEELDLGPNGGLLFAMEHLLDNIQWLEDVVASFVDDEYFLIDCPGQIELYTHVPVMRRIVEHLERMDVRICCVYCLDIGFLTDAARFLSGALSALSAMVQLQLPHVNVLTKCDLMENEEVVEEFLEREPRDFLPQLQASTSRGFKKLNESIAELLEEFDLVAYLPLNVDDEESIGRVVAVIDNSIQYGEDIEVNDRYDMNDSGT